MLTNQMQTLAATEQVNSWPAISTTENMCLLVDKEGDTLFPCPKRSPSSTSCRVPVVASLGSRKLGILI